VPSCSGWIESRNLLAGGSSALLSSGSVLRSDVEQAGKMGEMIGHVSLLKRESPARDRA
jgi:hypothetical protein